MSAAVETYRDEMEATYSVDCSRSMSRSRAGTGILNTAELAVPPRG